MFAVSEYLATEGHRIMQVRITERADKELRKIGPQRAKIMGKIDQYATDPASLANNVKALQGRDGYRLRVGDYRVLFTVEGNTLIVKAVHKRGEAYG